MRSKGAAQQCSAKICLELGTDTPLEHLTQISEKFLRAALARTGAEVG